MKSYHPRKYTFIFCTSSLATFLFVESAQADGPGAALGLAILIIGLANIVLYGLVLSCSVRGIWVWHCKRKIAIWSIVLATLPFLHYSIQVIRAQFETGLRSQQTANLIQQIIVPAIQPRSIETNGFEPVQVGALVAAGVVDEVQTYYQHQNKTLVHKLLEGPECIDFETSGGARAEFRRVVLARYAFQRCVKRTKREGPANAQIQLLTGNRAPNRYTGPACLGGGNRPLELKWTPQNGGTLIAFWESPSFIAYAFPPVLLGGDQIWRCKELHPNNPEYHFPDAFKFISNALGYKSIDDFPKSLDITIVPKALQQLITKMDSRYANDHIIALLGQWPSTPMIDKTLNVQRVYKDGKYILRKALFILTEPNEEKRKVQLYPYLITHVPTLLKICLHQSDRRILDSCSKLTE